MRAQWLAAVALAVWCAPGLAQTGGDAAGDAAGDVPAADGMPQGRPGPALPAPATPGAAVNGMLVIRQDALFENSAFGRAARARIEGASRSLAAENREIEAALEAEERTLTDRRATLPPAEFRALADAFNEKVDGIRQAQDAKVREIGRMRDAEQQRFLSAAIPVLAELMREAGASVLLDQGSVVLSLETVDITDVAVARIDAAIGTGAAPTDTGQAPGPATSPTDGSGPVPPLQQPAPSP